LVVSKILEATRSSSGEAPLGRQAPGRGGRASEREGPVRPGGRPWDPVVFGARLVGAAAGSATSESFARPGRGRGGLKPTHPSALKGQSPAPPAAPRAYDP
jgi:hypothetical protein